ncbi:hypothetical protein [Maridesulfovibrio sp.]|uniref:hypothetical protein n=1 Tax=Maridesulfovibrio sp. TaxID=2795000 RepID=UPI0039F118B9
MSVSLIMTNFSAGELSPRLGGRVDLAKYANGLAKLENMFTHPHGGASRRTGFRFIGEATANKVRLIPFEFSTEQAYVLEFSDRKIRVYKDGGIVLNSGSAVEITSPYTASDLAKIRFTQSADVMYLVHPEIQPYKLSRTSHVDWSMGLVPFSSPPEEWNSSNGFPSCVTFFEERLCFAASPANPQTVWMSKAGAYEDFGISDPLVDDDACTYTLSADQVNAIRWMVSSKKLILGTSGGEWWLSGGSSADSVTPNSVMVRRETTHGSAAIPPVVVGGVMLFLQREGRTIRELAYSFEADGYVAPDLTILAEHLTRSNSITEWAYQQSPDSIVWMVRDDGVLLGLTYQREHEVVSFHRHLTDGKFRSVCSIPGPTQDEVWVVVDREVNGTVRSYVERMENQFDGSGSEGAFFVDSGLSYDQGVSNTVFTGLDHLEGKTVSVLADGAVHPDVAVENGAITLTAPAKIVHAGLPYVSNMKTLRIEGGAMSGGTAQGRMKRISHVTVRLFQSLGLQVGYDGDHLERAPFRSSADKVGGAPALYTGDYEVKFNRGYDRDGQIYIRQDQPLPLSVLALIPEVSVYS